MTKTKALEILKILKETYPDATCSLDFTNAFEIVVAVMLSAQCTDERVNKTTPNLFKRCKTIKDYTEISLDDLEKIIKPCGLYKNKAKNIKMCANDIIKNYKGIVPSTMKKLLSLPGIGRKSANVILLEAFGITEGIAVDTHVKRISNKIGLSLEKDPEKIEQDLIQLYQKKYYKDINHIFVWHGRKTCIAKKPLCEKCTIKRYCEYYKKLNP